MLGGEAMVIALSLINTEPGKDREVAKKLAKIEGVTAVCLVTGRYDVVARIEAKNSDEVINIVYDKIRATPNVKASETMFCQQIK
jgi:DNA-binding Lrp family transcriptional regulator